MRVSVRAAVVAVVSVCAALPVQAQRNQCTKLHPLVDAVDIKGTNQVPKSVIAPIPITERTSVWRRVFGWKIGPLTCLDSADVASDAAQIAEEYHQRGFIGATVAGTVQRHGDRRARVTFRVHEGAPVRITHVDVTGFPREAGDSAAVRRLLLGKPLDDSVVNAVADSLQNLVRDAGHARALPPMVRQTTDSAQREGSVQFGFVPGPLTYIGNVTIRIVPSGSKPALGEAAVRAAFNVHEGQPYSAQRINQGQRELSSLDLYRTVHVDTASAAGATGKALDTIGIAISVVESDRHRAHTTAGWGTLDCFRTQTRFVEQNFLSLGHQLELNGRLSKIGIAAPFGGLESLCAPTVRNDPFSQNLNYYAGATLRLRGLPAWGGRHWEPQLSLYSERRSVVGAYEQTTELGALVTTAHHLGERLTGTVEYGYTDSRTNADRAVACSRFGFCRLEDVASFLLRTPEHSVAVSLVKNPLLPTDDPQSGYRWSASAKYGHASIGKTLPIDFGRFVGEVATYVPVASWLTVATRMQVGAVVSPADRSFLLPPSERFYGGGQNSVRGYGQNLLGPGSYIVTAIDTITGVGGTTYGVAVDSVQPSRIAPSGGNASWLFNLELRTRRGWPADLLRWVLFVDVGRVWNTRDVFSVTNADLRATPGIGVRLITPLGPFRVDVGYNPNGVVAGPAFLVQSGDLAAGIPGRAICVSPGSDDPLNISAGHSPSSNSCPATFLPPKSVGLLSRLTFHFSLGNAF